MATSDGSTLEDLITCNVCLQIYTNPHALQCLHTFCYGCIGNLKQGNWVQCPDCREESKFLKIKRDFKLQGFIDFHTKSTQEITSRTTSSRTTRTTRCDACLCQNCEKFLCRDCVKAHRRNKASKYHELSSYDDVSKVNHSKMENYMRKFQSKLLEVENDRKRMRESINNIATADTEQVAKVNMERERIIQLVNQHHDKLITEIRYKNTGVVETLEMYNNLLTKTAEQLKEKITLMSNAMQSSDVSLLTDMVQTLSKTSDTELQKLHEQIPRPNQAMKSPIIIVKGEGWDPDNATRIDEDTSVTMPLIQEYQMSNRAKIRYSEAKVRKGRHKTSPELQQTNEIHQIYRLQQVKCAGIMYKPRKLCVKDDRVWVAAGGEGVYVYDIDLNQIKIIEESRLGYVTSVLKIPKYVIVCNRDDGLHQLSHKGDYQGQLLDGHFSDVCTHNNVLYAFDFYDGVIHALKTEPTHGYSGYKRNIWEEEMDWQLPKHTVCSENDKLCATSAGVYLSSYEDNCVLGYSHTGKFIWRLTFHNQLGPYLSDVDYRGRLLVCHYRCNRVDIFCPQVKICWKVTGLEGLDSPLCAGAGYKHLWVGTGDVRGRNELKKYEVRENDTCTEYFDRITQSSSFETYEISD